MLYSENVEKKNTLDNICHDIQPLHLLCCKSTRKKNRKKISTLESLFFTWQTLTYDDTVFYVYSKGL